MIKISTDNEYIKKSYIGDANIILADLADPVEFANYFLADLGRSRCSFIHALICVNLQDQRDLREFFPG
jgi:hypothetical protein